jgi:hypothetical protein
MTDKPASTTILINRDIGHYRNLLKRHEEDLQHCSTEAEPAHRRRIHAVERLLEALENYKETD